MSKYVKDLLTKDISRRLSGVSDCVLANVIGLDCNSTVSLRKELRSKNISLLVVKNSLAKRATEGTALAPAFEGLTGSAAVLWGADDFVSLVKEIARLDQVDRYQEFAALGGVMEGEPVTAAGVAEISKWPSRTEQLSLLVGQMLGAGGQLVAQISGPGGQLASQIEKIGGGGED